ncbi:dTDP-4-dehydrorhamnose reductase [Kocuria rhizophila]|uniref:dTDP-4-dehydrorhamnose reductase n=1 Tax=Kocuria rhizophila TaxID=72000 RepID=UPI0021A78AAE|nr:dTDP-4-dehydrorhamnose reductase [Kocuria rhizophila]MCT2171771.1 dTDP-4-dehydrorhamnose reductase [Kocuria rhizophila]MCT2249515.1 dTDP-4-dehydrorhamnose reductase [Kocuria rhizophila]
MNAQDLTVHTTAIDGLLLVELPVHGDNRGWFKENWQRAKAVAAGLPDASFVQHNISFNGSRGTTRGIHAEPWDKYVSVATGRIFGAWVDLRQGPGFGTVVTHEVTSGTAVFVPRGVGNAFQTLEEATAYTYLVTDHWRADATAEYSFVNLGDPRLGIEWPVPLAQAELSDKDRAHPALDDVAPLAPAPVLVLGARGQVGAALTELLTASELPFTSWTRSELDLADPASWPAEISSGDALRRYRAVVNAAAFTAVDAAESTEGRAAAWAVNATGVGALAAACARAGTTLVHFSTDYVFDGALPLGSAYAPEDPVAPLSVYGQSKAAGETAVRACPRHYVIRTSWVIGQGKNFVATMADLARCGVDPAVVADQHGRLTAAADLAEGALHLVDSGAAPGTYHLTGSGEPCTWAEIARWVFEELGADPEWVRPVGTAEYTAGKVGIAPRPTNSCLDTTSLEATGFSPRDSRAVVRSVLSTTHD